MTEKNWGNLVIAIDPKLLGQGEFEKRAAIVTDRVKNAKKMPGVDEILLPGRGLTPVHFSPQPQPFLSLKPTL